MNKKITITFALMSLCLLSTQAFAQEHKVESWYLYFALGYANLNYPDDLQNGIDQLKDDPDISHVSLDLDMLGIYWPLSNQKTLLGLNLNAGADRFEEGNVSLQFNQIQASFSTMHFLTDIIGKGLFLRGDVGLGVLNVQASAGNFLTINESSESGFAFTAGGGYSFPVSSGTRIVLNANYSNKRIEGERFGKFNISVGGLF